MLGAGKMAQWAKNLPHKPGEFCPGTHIQVEGENQLSKVILPRTHVKCDTQLTSTSHTHAQQ